MKIFIILLLSFMCTGLYSITNRRATLTDVPSLMKLYDDMTEDDKKKLVLVPKKFRAQKLIEAIEKKHVFGAFTESNKAVAMVHVYLLSNEEFISKLSQFNWTQLTKPIRAEAYEVCSFKLRQSCDTFHSNILEEKFQTSVVEARIYIGSAYTLKANRGNRVMSKLNAFALESLKQDIDNTINLAAKRYIGKGYINRLVVLYGQVAAYPEDEEKSLKNIKRHFILRAVSKFLVNSCYVDSEQHQLRQFVYKHFLPKFRTVNNELAVSKSDVFAYGCILTSQVFLEHD